MLDQNGFNQWAEQYDNNVQQIEKTGKYPFAGYKQVLNTIYQTIHKAGKGSILDIGFGTGTLTKKLYDDGFQISGIDFSEAMIQKAKAKMPNANLVAYDFSHGIPPEFANQSFDFVVCTYAIHHIRNPQKTALIQQLKLHLKPSGKILIGDVSFRTKAEQDACRTASGDAWDNDEFYIVFDELASHLGHAEFQKISSCAGITTIEKEA